MFLVCTFLRAWTKQPYAHVCWQLRILGKTKTWECMFSLRPAWADSHTHWNRDFPSFCRIIPVTFPELPPPCLCCSAPPHRNVSQLWATVSGKVCEEMTKFWGRVRIKTHNCCLQIEYYNVFICQKRTFTVSGLNQQQKFTSLWETRECNMETNNEACSKARQPESQEQRNFCCELFPSAVRSWKCTSLPKRACSASLGKEWLQINHLAGHH